MGEIIMKNNVDEIISNLKKVENPIVKAKKISFYLSDLLKQNEVNLYEAYLLNREIINYAREWYILPAWNGRVQILTCISILNQRLLALAFGDSACAKQLQEWGEEAMRLCAEKRSHYIMDKYLEFLNVEDGSDDLLQELLSIREKQAILDNNKGPFHTEVFPYHYYEPEKFLLDGGDLESERKISEDIEKLLIELNM